MKTPALAVLLALGALCGSVRAAPQYPGVSYSTWVVSPSERTVTLRMRIPRGTAQRLTGTVIPVLTASALGNDLLARTAVRNAGADCPASDQGYDLGRVDPLDVGAGFFGFELVFRCKQRLAGLTLENRALFDRDPAHVDFARIERGRQFAAQLFTAHREQLAFAGGAALPHASAGRYVRLGGLHVLQSPLRLAFLLAALVLVRRSRDLFTLLAGLTVGYVLAFLAQAGGDVLPRLPLVEAFIGLLVAFLALRIALRGMARPAIVRTGWPALLAALALAAVILRTPQAALLFAGGALVSVGLLRPQRCDARFERGLALAAGLYGFVDGWVLPALLAPLHLAAATRAGMLIGYDAGALLVDAALAAPVLGVAYALHKAGFLEALRPAIEEAGAACLAGLGTFWLVASAVRTIPPAPLGKAQPSIAETLAHVDETTANPDSLLMRNYYLMGNTLIPMSEKPKD